MELQPRNEVKIRTTAAHKRQSFFTDFCYSHNGLRQKGGTTCSLYTRCVYTQGVLTSLFQTILLICLNHVLKSIIDKLDHLVLWIYLYVACQQGSGPLLSEEPNSGTP